MRVALLLAAPLCVLAAAAPARAGDQDFTLVNHTGYQIDNLYVSPSASNSWGNEVLGENTVLQDNMQIPINFPRAARACMFDMKVMYHNNVSATWNKINLCQISTVTLYYDRRSNVTRASTE